MERRSFIKGGLVGIAVTAVGAAGIKAVQGDFKPYLKPLNVINIRPLDPSEMRVVLLGTGCPTPNNLRSKPALVVLAGNKVVLVDCGAGTVDRIMEAGLTPSMIDNVFFTHHHSDHNSGFIDFFISRSNDAQQTERQGPMNVYGPSNSKLILGKLLDHLQWDISLRVHQANNNPDALKLNINEGDDGLVYDQDGLKVTAFTVDHGIVKPAIGYTFEYNGKMIVVSGDTRPCAMLVEKAQGADILIHEAYSQLWLDKALEKFPDLAETVAGIKKYHTSIIEAADVAEKAKVKHMVCTHLIPAPSPVWFYERSWASGASDHFSGKITIGRDLQEFG